MKRWMLTIDGVPTTYYEDQWEANCDAQHLRHIFGSMYNVDVKEMTLSWK